jgi:hypothetical protein
MNEWILHFEMGMKLFWRESGGMLWFKEMCCVDLWWLILIFNLIGLKMPRRLKIYSWIYLWWCFQRWLDDRVCGNVN